MSDCLSLRGVSKSFEAGVRGCSATVRVLNDLDLDVYAGEIVGVHAAPSSGKTTLLMCAAGLLRPDRGAVSWFGRPAARNAVARPDGIAFVSDRPFPYAFLSVREAVEYAAIVRDLPLADHSARVSEALERTRLAAIAHRRVDALDGGQVSRLALASALLSSPRLLLVDDLGSGCDATTALELLTLLRSTAAGGAGVLIAGRLVPWLASEDATRRPRVAPASLATRVPGRFVSLVGGKIGMVAHGAADVPRRASAPLAAARVAEWALPSARQNEAR